MLRDAHVHMTRLPSFIETVSILKSKKVTAVSGACAPWEWPILEKLSRSFENIEAAYGLHPYEIGSNYQKDLEKCLDYLKQNPDSKVGETGIDRRFPGYAPKEEQESVFIFQAKVALEFKRPLIIHCVGDYLRLFQILSSLGYPSSDAPIHLHRFAAKKHLLEPILSLQCHISLHQDSFKGNDLALFIKNIPEERFEFETDADETFAPKETPPEETANRLIERLEQNFNHFRELLDSNN